MDHFVSDDCTGDLSPATYNTWKYFVKEFGRTVEDKFGQQFPKGDLPLNKVRDAYNPQGWLIASRK